METILGIDLGTTNSAVAVVHDDGVKVLRSGDESILPSVVGLDSQGELLVGHAARNQFVLAPDRTVRSIKRQMGEAAAVTMGETRYTPQEVSAIILRTLKERAEQELGHAASKAVITVPAFFNEQQREATREAGELAGLEVVRIINEPTAASLVYESNSTGRQRLLVYDLGGGTFDVSVVQIEQGVVEVLSSHGDTHLGGDDFDQLLLEHVCDAFEDEHGIDLRESPTSRSRVLHAVEEAKKQLSYEPYVRIEEEFIAEQDGTALHLNLEIARREYEEMIEPLISKTMVCLDESLADAKLTVQDIDRVILVGGASRTPLVHEMLRDQLERDVHGELDPDLCVAMGAAIQGGMIGGADVGPVLVDITPHTLGIQCVGSLHGFMSEYCFSSVIERNTPLPASRSEAYGTNFDNQQIVDISVFQGESEDVRHNELVGEFTLEGLAEVERGNTITVRFDLDLDGILKVTAAERDTGLARDLTIDNPMARFRRSNRDAAQQRIDAVFGNAAAGAAESEAPLEAAAPGRIAHLKDLPEELKPLADKACDLLDRSAELMESLSEEDADEMDNLVDRLATALDRHAREDIEEALTQLDDLVFYLQDA